jgi:predicted nucleic acid-binding Zn ribbon protein
MNVSPLEHILNFGATGSWNLGDGPNSDGNFGMKQYEQNQMLMPEIVKPVRRYRCEKCGKMYTWKQGLLDHLRFVCGKDPQFHCSVCNYKTHRKGNLTRHMILLHKIDPYKKQ